MLSALLPRKGFTQDNTIPSYGRVMADLILAYQEPSFSSPPNELHPRDRLFPIRSIVIGDTAPHYNQAWYEIDKVGYIHSAQLQPVEIIINEPQTELHDWGSLAEVTVPFTNARVEPKIESEIAYRYYYSTTHWIDLIRYDANGDAWYRVVDDKVDERFYYVLAKHLRVIPETELELLSPGTPPKDKRIEVLMNAQMIVAYEEHTPVFIAQCSTGDDFTNKLWHTPLGGFLTFYKRPSRHMVAGNLAFGDYDLPGVPWCCYLTDYGIAIHGTYWHNDFGRRRSHGCINLQPEAAKWIYNWTVPTVAPHNKLKYTAGRGTRVDIIG